MDYKDVYKTLDADDNKEKVRYKKSMRKRLISGIKPTGSVHIGNYFGTMKQLIELQDSYESFVFIADYHALNQIHDQKQLSAFTLETAKAYLAVGINPEKAVLFRQSDVPTTTELCWILNSITPMGLLMRAHAFKDAQAKHEPVNAGLFDYPVLMAADILELKAHVVPVGKDQAQHLEMTVDIAETFNRIYGKTFEAPRILLADAAIVKGLDGRKMSKSYGNVIGLFDSARETSKKIRSIVTDSTPADAPKNPETCTVFHLHRLFSGGDIPALRRRYLEGTISYQESKEMLSERVNQYFRPIREKKKELDESPKQVLDILKKGGERARAVAESTLREVRNKIGIGI